MTPIILDTTPGTASIQSNQLIGATVLVVSLEGLQFDIVYDPPTGRQVRVDNVTGTLDWSGLLPFLPNAKAFALIN